MRSAKPFRRCSSSFFLLTRVNVCSQTTRKDTASDSENPEDSAGSSSS